MSHVFVKLDGENLKALVKGKEVILNQVHIILADIGFDQILSAVNSGIRECLEEQEERNPTRP